MEMAKCKASLRSQCPCDWLRIHAKTIGERESIIILKIYHVKGGSTRPMILTSIVIEHNGILKL
jgi:hypothetical protein